MTRPKFLGGYPAGMGTCEVCNRTAKTLIAICTARAACTKPTTEPVKGRHYLCQPCADELVPIDVEPGIAAHVIRCPETLSEADRTFIALRYMA